MRIIIAALLVFRALAFSQKKVTSEVSSYCPNIISRGLIIMYEVKIPEGAIQTLIY